MIDSVPGAARLEMRVLQQVRHRVHGPGQQSRSLRRGDGLAFAQRCQPVGVGAFDGIDERLWLRAHRGADLWMIKEVFTANQPQQAR